ncbi:PspA/IM30 family protein [Ideonella sp. DXS29W]|uniref:PspA/IM30 family protein n=1 Tax=Ideonella lacteola TaxID=2984193 RepID=A0ABU9BZU3_9BURK
MADSLKTRVGRVIAGGVHALLDRLEDQAPEAMMEQAIREADSVVADVRHELGTTSANRHLAQQQHLNLNRQHEVLSEQLNQALAQQREDLARVAVARQLDIEAQLPVLESTLAELARQEAELRGYVEALLAKRREMDTALADFRKSRQAAHAHVAPGRTAGQGPADQRMAAATQAFDRVHLRQTGLNAAAAGATLQQAASLKELEELVRQNKIEERLAQWKAQL